MKSYEELKAKMTRSEVTFIAEIGLNHNGNFGLFFELIKQASLSGADFAKFQLGWRSKPGEINSVESHDIENILKCCDHFNIEPLFSVFDEASFELTEKYEMQAYKIASRTAKEKPDLVETIIKTNKPVFISLGMVDNLSPFGVSETINYLWCQSLYPVHPWETKPFPQGFGEKNLIGFSDHSVGIELALFAITKGATVIEKHFTLDKSDVTIRDHALSLSPDEFRQLTSIGREIKKYCDLGL